MTPSADAPENEKAVMSEGRASAVRAHALCMTPGAMRQRFYRRRIALARSPESAVSGDGKACRLLILLLAVFVQHQDFHLVLALRPAGSRRREGEIRRAAAGQVKRLRESRNRPALLPRNVVHYQSSRHLHLAWDVRDFCDGVDRIVRAEAACLLSDALIFAEFQAADVGRRHVETTGGSGDEQEQ